MAVVPTYHKSFSKYGATSYVQNLTQASTGTRVKRHGTTVITSAASGSTGTHGFIMDKPTAGVQKSIVVDANSTRVVQVFNASTGVTFLSSTGNSIAFSTGTGVKFVSLLGLSTSQWAITSQSTGVTTPGSTVSA